MGYRFTGKLLKPFARMADASDQAAAVQDNFWNPDALRLLRDDPSLLAGFMDDLNGLLAMAEAGKLDKEDFEATARTFLSMTAGGEHAFLRDLYALDPARVGVFLMRCMRVSNLATHSSAALKAFGVLFRELGIRIEGDWDLCVRVASFEWTQFADGTLTVAPPGG